ncbi:hypothetical protein FB45DRAFT_1065180, partial [Roridomyces roridus]
MTKPLLQFMYHRQALEYIAVNEDTALTEAILDICSSYLECKYVASKTKVRVLSHLSSRAHFDMDAQMIVDSSVFFEIPQLLESPQAHIRRESSELMATLARKSVVAPEDSLNRIAEKLGLLLRDDNTAVVGSAVHALVRIVVWQEYDDAAMEDINDRTALSLRPSYHLNLGS